MGSLCVYVCVSVYVCLVVVFCCAFFGGEGGGGGAFSHNASNLTLFICVL